MGVFLMASTQNAYSFSHRPIPQHSVNRFRSLKKKKRVRKKARDIISERYSAYSSNRANLLSILSLVIIFIVLFYLSPHP